MKTHHSRWTEAGFDHVSVFTLCPCATEPQPFSFLENNTIFIVHGNGKSCSQYHLCSDVEPQCVSNIYIDLEFRELNKRKMKTKCYIVRANVWVVAIFSTVMSPSDTPTSGPEVLLLSGCPDCLVVRRNNTINGLLLISKEIKRDDIETS